MYTAAILRDNDANLLKWIMRGTLRLEEHGYSCFSPRGYELPHHMTINLGRVDSHLNEGDVHGALVALHVQSLWHSDLLGVCAAKVKKAVRINADGLIPLHTMNDESSAPHITICLRHGVKPVVSNQLFQPGSQAAEYNLDRVYMLEACIEEVE